jgi:SAM-dependent methyltransferase
MDSYRLLARDYDALNPKEEIFRQRGFFRSLIREHRVRDVLDCACGTGWHLLLLQQLGLGAFGSDLSPDMLAAARRNLRGKRIPLQRGDFRHLDRAWSQRFGMVVCLTTSLPHMQSDREVVAALRSMYDRLLPGGIVVISNGIADAMLDAKPRFVIGRQGRSQAFYFVLEYPDPAHVVFNVLSVRKTRAGFAAAHERIPYNAMRRSVLARCFARTDFRRVRYYGDYRFTPYSRKRSRRLIAVAER